MDIIGNATGDGVPEEFWEIADTFIHLANDLAQEWPIARVSAATMYATARYNAFTAAAQDADVLEGRDEIAEYFCRQYRQMLIENLDDHLRREKD